jgi:hypothetical protein
METAGKTEGARTGTHAGKRKQEKNGRSTEAMRTTGLHKLR